MGLCYIKTNEIDTTLTKLIKESHPSQGPIDYGQEETDVTTNQDNSILRHVSSQEALPPWLREQGKSN